LFQCPFVTHSWYYSFGSDWGSLSLFLPFPLLGPLFNRICQDTFSFLQLIVGNCLVFINVHFPLRKGRIFTLITLIIYQHEYSKRREYANSVCKIAHIF
jgi:hypothetical protein